MTQPFDVRVYGAGYMGCDLHLKATAEQIEGRDECAFWNSAFRKGRLPIGNAAGWRLISAEVLPMNPHTTQGNKTFHDVVVAAVGQPLANGQTGEPQRKVVATVFAKSGEIQPTMLLGEVQ